MKNLLRGQKISLIVSGLLLTSSIVFAADEIEHHEDQKMDATEVVLRNVDSIDAAFKEGKASGSLALYGEKHDNKNGNSDSGYGNANATIGFETASFYGLSAKAEFKGNLYLGEVENDNYNDSFVNNALMTEAYIKYINDKFSLTAGRQAIDLEWLGDYNEAVVAAITAIPDTTIVLAYSQRQAESGIDRSADFEDINGNKGIYALDAKYVGLEGIEFNPYVYSVPDVVDFYGLKTTFTTDYFGITTHYAQSSIDKIYGTTNGYEDGSIGHLELNTTVSGVSGALGYIQTDKNGGVGAMDIAGDNISPFDTGNNTYSANAKTVYGSLGYSFAGVDLGALYGETTFGSADYKEKELNLTIAYAITDFVATSILYGDVNADKSNGDSDDNYVLASIEYTF
jgi:hypothetical protein